MAIPRPNGFKKYLDRNQKTGVKLHQLLNRQVQVKALFYVALIY